MVFRCAMRDLHDLRNLRNWVIMMVNFKKYLQESKDRKFDAISRKKDSEHNPYSCNYSPVSHHKYCEHEHCILSDEFRDYDKERTFLENKLREEESYLKNLLGERQYDKREDKGY